MTADLAKVVSPRVRRAIGLILCLDRVEQQAIYELLVHRVECP